MHVLLESSLGNKCNRHHIRYSYFYILALLRCNHLMSTPYKNLIKTRLSLMITPLAKNIC